MARRTRTYKAQIRRTKTLNKQVFPGTWQGPNGVGRGKVRVVGCSGDQDAETTEDLQKGRPVVKVGGAIIAAAGPRPGPSSIFSVPVGQAPAPEPPLEFPGGPGGEPDFLMWFRSGSQTGAAGYAYNVATGEIDYLGAFGVVVSGEDQIGRSVFLGSIDGDRSFVDDAGNMRRIRYSTGETASFGASPGWALGPGINRWLEVEATSAATTDARPAGAFNFDGSDYAPIGPTDTITGVGASQWAPVSCRGGNHAGGSALHYIFVRQGANRWIPKGIQPGGVAVPQGTTVTQEFYSSPRPAIGVGGARPFDEIVPTLENEEGVEYRILRKSLTNGDLDEPPNDFFSTHPAGFQDGLDGCKTGSIPLLGGGLGRAWILRTGQLMDIWAGDNGFTGTYHGTAAIADGPVADGLALEPIGVSAAFFTILPPT